jgi:hypothetical protein
MNVKRIIVALVLVLNASSLSAQQVADTSFDPTIQYPGYTPGNGPVVLIDEAHNNFHTRNGRFSPFAHVLEKDGYVVLPNTSPLSLTELRKGKILVIANALHVSNLNNWSLPTPSAFTDEEIQEINAWVKEGGALFLIADHMPFPGAADKLASSFGFKFYNGFATKGGAKDIFTLESGLTSNALTQGRNKGESVNAIQTFTGQAFEIPSDAIAVILLNEKYKIRLPETAWVFNKKTPEVSGDQHAQGAFLRYGKGRVVVFGEAAMFTAQLQGKTKMGMNTTSASQNVQLLLNTIHWLDGIID